jgi:hypothetical protein
LTKTTEKEQKEFHITASTDIPGVVKLGQAYLTILVWKRATQNSKYKIKNE